MMIAPTIINDGKNNFLIVYRSDFDKAINNSENKKVTANEETVFSKTSIINNKLNASNV